MDEVDGFWSGDGLSMAGARAWMVLVAAAAVAAAAAVTAAAAAIAVADGRRKRGPSGGC